MSQAASDLRITHFQFYSHVNIVLKIVQPAKYTRNVVTILQLFITTCEGLLYHNEDRFLHTTPKGVLGCIHLMSKMDYMRCYLEIVSTCLV